MSSQKRKQKRDSSGIGIDVFFTREMLTDPKALKHGVRTFRKRLKSVARATAIGLNIHRGVCPDPGSEDLLDLLGYPSPENVDSELDLEAKLRLCYVVYSRTHCLFIDVSDQSASKETRRRYPELQGAKIRRATTRLPFGLLYRRR